MEFWHKIFEWLMNQDHRSIDWFCSFVRLGMTGHDVLERIEKTKKPKRKKNRKPRQAKKNNEEQN